MRRWRWIDDLGQDVRYAVRTLILSHRTFAVTAVLTLAIGIGATTAVFSIVSGLLLRPLPFPHPDRLVQLHGTTPRPVEGAQITNLGGYRRESTSFEALAGYEVGARYMRDGGGAERVMVVRTEPAFFAVLGVPALYGRTYGVDDALATVVLGQGFWKRRFAGNPDIIGRTLTLDGKPFTIAAVMPEWFQFPDRGGSLLQGSTERARTDLWMPFDDPLSPRSRIGSVTGRLKAGVPLAAAQSELNAISRQLDAQSPDANRGRGVSIV